MTPEIISYIHPLDFLDECEAELEREEAAHSLLISLARRLAAHPELIREPPVLAAVREGGELRLAAVRTSAAGKLILAPHGGGSSTAACERLAAWLAGEQIHLTTTGGEGDSARMFAQAWERACRCTAREGIRQRLYRLDEVTAPQGVAGRLRPAGDTEADLLSEWAYAFTVEVLGTADREEAREMVFARLAEGSLFVWEDGGEVVSMAARVRPTRHCMTVSTVYTPPEQRAHGYASAGVAALSQLILNDGYAFAVLFTDLSNPISNAIYQRVGYRPVVDFNNYIFEEQSI